jgi:hypothetical protein
VARKGPPLVVQDPTRIVRVNLSGTQWAALLLAGATGVSIILLTAVVLALVVFDLPSRPAFSADAEVGARALADYKTLNSLVTERATVLFDLIVVKTFLPVFTAMVGYLFGSTRLGNSGTSG